MNTYLKTKPKILHLITIAYLAVGGAQDNALLTVEKHDRTSFDIHIASHPDGKWSDRAKKATENFNPLLNLVHPIHPFKDALCLFDLVQPFHQEKADRFSLLLPWEGIPNVFHLTFRSLRDEKSAN